MITVTIKPIHQEKDEIPMIEKTIKIFGLTIFKKVIKPIKNSDRWELARF